MGAAFSTEKPLKDIIRENQRMIKKAIREMEREIASLKTQEKKLTADIKKSAKANQMVANCPRIYDDDSTLSRLLTVDIYCRDQFG
jgi:F0F1-type ATP synthase membrane subunit b/b'